MVQILVPGSAVFDEGSGDIESLVPGGSMVSSSTTPPPTTAVITSATSTLATGTPTAISMIQIRSIVSATATYGVGVPIQGEPPPDPPQACTDPDDYVNLIPPANRSAPNFVSVVRSTTDPALDLRDLLCDFGRWFSLDDAVGAQLDIVGEWVGVDRYVSDGIVPFFSFGDPLLGFGRGVWKTTVNPPSGLFALDDDSFRSLIRLKIAANNWDGTMETLPAVLEVVFAPTVAAYLVVLDNQDMSMTIAISGEYPGSLIIALLREGLFPVKPAGVRVNSRITTSFGNPVFGFGVDNQYIGGFGNGAWAEEL